MATIHGPTDPVRMRSVLSLEQGDGAILFDQGVRIARSSSSAPSETKGNLPRGEGSPTHPPNRDPREAEREREVEGG